MKDDQSWDSWAEFCEVYGWDTLFLPAEASSRPDLVVSRLALFVLWVYPRIVGRGGPDAKPRSAYNYVISVIRICQRNHGVPMPRLKLVEPSVRSLLRNYKEIYSVQALTARRRQPMLPKMWQQIEAAPNGIRLPRGRPWDPIGNLNDRNILRLGRVLWRSGHRLGEIVRSDLNEINYLTRFSCTYSISGVLVTDPSAAQLRMLKVGDFVLLEPCASKPDQFGEEHSPFPSVLPFTDPLSAAAERDIELERPCHGKDARRKMALFANASGTPYTYACLNPRLHELLEGLFGAAVSSTLSWHSIWIGLACALHAAGCPDAVIQLICRWASEASLKVYRLLGVTAHVDWCNRAARAQFEATRVNNLPALDNSVDYAALLASPAARPAAAAAARRVVAAAAPLAAVPPAPLLAQQRVDVYWTGHSRWFTGTFTSSRFGVDDSGAPIRRCRILYGASDGWPATALWFNLAVEAWRLAS